MKDSLFEVESGRRHNFIGNRKTGKWVLIKKGEDKTNIPEIEDFEIEPIKFTGTRSILFNISHACNLACTYCHVGKEKDNMKMSFEVAEKAIDSVLELLPSNRQVTFHGSEPLANFPLIKHAVNYANGKIRFAMQSNGTLFNDDIISFLKKNNVGSGISLDGLRCHQDATRPYVGGYSTYDTVSKNIQKLRKDMGGLSVITVVSKNNVNDLREIAKDFERQGIYSLRFNPLFPTGGNMEDCPDVSTLTENVINIMDEYIERLDKEKNSLRITNSTDIIRTIFNEKKTYNCAKCSGTSNHPLMGVDINGDIYPCDFFWGRNEYKIGNIFEMSLKEAANHPKNFRVYRDISKVEECVDCDWTMYCGDGCPGGQVMNTGKLTGKNHYCEYNKGMLTYMAKKLPALVERGLVEKILFDQK